MRVCNNSNPQRLKGVQQFISFSNYQSYKEYAKHAFDPLFLVSKIGISKNPNKMLCNNYFEVCNNPRATILAHQRIGCATITLSYPLKGVRLIGYCCTRPISPNPLIFRRGNCCTPQNSIGGLHPKSFLVHQRAKFAVRNLFPRGVGCWVRRRVNNYHERSSGLITHAQVLTTTNFK